MDDADIACSTTRDAVIDDVLDNSPGMDSGHSGECLGEIGIPRAGFIVNGVNDTVDRTAIDLSFQISTESPDPVPNDLLAELD